jgi:hypothetical protein
MPFSKTQFTGMDKKEFTAYLSKSSASSDSKARYEREWRRYNQASGGPEPRKPVTYKPSRIIHQKGEEYEPGEERAVKFRNAGESSFQGKGAGKGAGKGKGCAPDYPISKKRLDVRYDTAKEDFKKYDPKTQQRYWRAWQQRRDEVAPERAKEYRVILKVNAVADGHKITYFSSFVMNKRRLNKKDLRALAEDLDAGTNVKVLNVEPYNTSDNWTGQKR